MEASSLINIIQATIEENVNAKIHGQSYRLYTKWDMEIEQGWNLKQSSLHRLKDKSIGRKNVKWCPPPPGWKKLNFDGASRGNPGLSGFGAMVRDEDDSLVGAICGASGIVSNNVVEITALEEGLNWVIANNNLKVVIEVDSQIILNGVNKKCFTNWRLNERIPRINQLLQNLEDYQVKHIYHEGNRVANLLAN
ncbi:hypothetical protein SUGI_1076090 [Cryptomeria japonica]|nr:hypothetical protein SUGI_1076090 [Cryptomeria japonica]